MDVCFISVCCLWPYDETDGNDGPELAIFKALLFVQCFLEQAQESSIYVVGDVCFSFTKD